MTRALILLLVCAALFGPCIVRVPLVDWTNTGQEATAGFTLWPFGIVLDDGPVGLDVLPHELCHWQHHDAILIGQAAIDAAERRCTDD